MLRQFVFLKIEQVSAAAAYYQTKHPFRKACTKKHNLCPSSYCPFLKKAFGLELDLTGTLFIDL
jgi:hypothetical protein